MTSFGARISANCVAGGELSVQERDSIISKAEAGCTTKELANEFGCLRCAIQKTIHRYKPTGNNQSRPRSGQPPKLSSREKRYAYRLVRQFPKIEYREMLQELGLWLDESNRPRVSRDTL
ncbi:hypothetical protein EJ02DRAFT_456037, partial [Clathrospora elynae]